MIGESEYLPIPINKIIIGDYNVRISDKEKGIEDLINSVLTYGLLQPIVVFKKDGKFNLIIGQRRLRAFKELKTKYNSKFEKIPAIVLPEEPDEETLKILSLSENIQRVELNRADIVEVVSYLYSKNNKDARKVAKILGKSTSYIYDYLKIQDAPEEIKKMYYNSEISKQDVRRVMEIAIDDSVKMIKLAKKMKELTGPEKERLVEVGVRNPNAKIEEIIEEAKKPYAEEKVIVPLSPDLIIALDRAVKEIGLKREGIAKMALKDWLINKGYYKK